MLKVIIECMELKEHHLMQKHCLFLDSIKLLETEPIPVHFKHLFVELSMFAISLQGGKSATLRCKVWHSQDVLYVKTKHMASGLTPNLFSEWFCNQLWKVWPLIWTNVLSLILSLPPSDRDYTYKSSHLGKLVALHVQTPWLPGKPV